MKIFLDVGGHIGETLGEVVNPLYRFDVIHCFEPQANCYSVLKDKFASADTRVTLHNFGLADFNGERDLYGEGMGASMFIDKFDIDADQYTKCHFFQASRFFNEHIKPDDLVVMELTAKAAKY